MTVCNDLAASLVLVLATLVACTADSPPDGDDVTGGAASTGTTSSDPASDGEGSSAGSTSTATGEATDGSGSASSENGTNEGSSSSGGEPLTGEELFLTQCAACHGADANGTTLGFELRHPVRGFSEWVVRNGRVSTELAPSAMIAFTPDILPDEQLFAIFDYLHTFPQPTTGEELYYDYCRNCHGLDARGGEVGVDLVDELEGRDVQDLRDEVRDGNSGDNYAARDEYMPAFTSNQLTEDEIGLVFEYLQSL